MYLSLHLGKRPERWQQFSRVVIIIQIEHSPAYSMQYIVVIIFVKILYQEI